ncbi:MAG: hypothetical protein PVH22_10010 [Desulfobacteraceae bacterium]
MRIGIIAQRQCPSNPLALPFERRPGVCNAFSNQITLKFSERGKQVENKGIVRGRTDLWCGDDDEVNSPLS